MIPKDYMKMVEGVMAEFSVERWRFGQDGKHPYVEFWLNGRRAKYALPSSPSDHMGLVNNRCCLRRMCRQQAGVPMR